MAANILWAGIGPKNGKQQRMCPEDKLKRFRFAITIIVA